MEEKQSPVVAKSGRKYHSIPEDMDIETWDAMTPIERMKHLGLISNEDSKWLEKAKMREETQKNKS